MRNVIFKRPRKNREYYVHDDTDVFRSLCQTTKRWGLFISYSAINVTNSLFEDFDLAPEVIKAAPYLDTYEALMLIYDKNKFLTFDTRKERDEAFDLTVGDEGPTKRNKYDGIVKIYALTCDPDGTFGNENT